MNTALAIVIAVVVLALVIAAVIKTPVAAVAERVRDGSPGQAGR
jgi:hypothetical protein